MIQNNSPGQVFYPSSTQLSASQGTDTRQMKQNRPRELQSPTIVDYWRDSHLRLRKNAIHVRNLPSSADRDSLMDYFKNFGRIGTVEISYRESRQQNGIAGSSGYCLVITKDCSTYRSILDTPNHVYRGRSLVCTPCVKGNRSLAILSQLMSPTRILLLQTAPLQHCVIDSELQSLLAPHAVALTAKYLPVDDTRQQRMILAIVRSPKEARKLLEVHTIERRVGSTKFCFEIKPFSSLASKSSSKGIMSSEDIAKEQEGRSSSDHQEPGTSNGSRAKCVFPPYHRLLPCRKNYYTKRVRFGGSLLEHLDADLRFNQAQTSLDWNKQKVSLDHNQPSAGVDSNQPEAARTPGGFPERLHLEASAEFECEPDSSVESSSRTITPRKEDETSQALRQPDFRRSLTTPPTTQ